MFLRMQESWISRELEKERELHQESGQCYLYLLKEIQQHMAAFGSSEFPFTNESHKFSNTFGTFKMSISML